MSIGAANAGHEFFSNSKITPLPISTTLATPSPSWFRTDRLRELAVPTIDLLDSAFFWRGDLR
jgi:hypothetical protein